MIRAFRVNLSVSLAAFILAGAGGSSAQDLPSATEAREHTVRYTISLQQTGEHRVGISIELPAGTAERDLQLPVWNALYQVRDFAQYVNWVKATDMVGHKLAVRMLNKSLWRVSGAENGLQLDYEVFANDPGPYGAELNRQHAFFNFAELLMYPSDWRSAPVQLRFTGLPAGWKIATPPPRLFRPGVQRRKL